MTWQSAKLRDLLASGWEVKGFAPNYNMDGSSDQFFGQTNGYAMLLQKGDQMAIVETSYDTHGGPSQLNVDILTEDR